MRPVAASLLAVAVLVLLACSAGESADPQAALVKRGEQLYRNNCTACHAQDPAQMGPVGPAIAGSSIELLEAKVLRNEYPPEHTPQRDTRAMIPLVHLEPELPAIAAYLGARDQE
ncbi:MAG: cytochrome c [Myxococcota bacterium]